MNKIEDGVVDDLSDKSDMELTELFAREVAGTEKFYFVVFNFNAVLPWLIQANSWQVCFDQGEAKEYSVQVWAPNFGEAEGESLARTAVIALIRAKRAGKGGGV